MTTVGWGIEPVKNSSGQVTSGTRSEDVRRTWNGLYTPGIISGCTVTMNSSNFGFRVAEGLVMVRVGANQVVPVAVDTTTVTGANPNGQTLYGSIVLRQPTGDTNKAILSVVNGTTTTLPTIPIGSQALYHFRYSPNATGANQSTQIGNYPYSVPYGADLGIFGWYTDTSNDLIPYAHNTVGHVNFTLPTDRKILVTLDTCLSATIGADKNKPAKGFDNAAYCEVMYEVYLDGVRQWAWLTPGLHGSWASYHFNNFANVRAGNHTIKLMSRYESVRGYNPGRAWRHHTPGDEGTGTFIAVRDAGIFDDGLGV